MSFLELYKKATYEPLVPTQTNETQMVFKFNSPQHYVSYISHLAENFNRGASQSSSDEQSQSTRTFTLSKSLEDAYEVIRTAKFDPTDTSVLETKISELKKGTQYQDEGYEIEVPEYLAGSDKVWLQPRENKRRTRLIDDTLLIDAAYNCDRSAEVTKKIGMMVLEGVYRRRVIPRKMVVMFGTMNVRSGISNGYMTSIDVSFMDLNGVAKVLHPSAFRRLWFRIAEIYPDLSWGYGNSHGSPTTKGYISIDTLYENYSNKEWFEKEIDAFLGITH